MTNRAGRRPRFSSASWHPVARCCISRIRVSAHGVRDGTDERAVARCDAAVGGQRGVGVRRDPQGAALDRVRRLRQVGGPHLRAVALQHRGQRPGGRGVVRSHGAQARRAQDEPHALAPDREHGIHPLDPDLAIAWPTEGRDGRPLELTLSGKDEQAPSLAQALATVAAEGDG